MVRRITLAGRIAVQTERTVLDERALPGRQLRLTFALLVAERHRAVERDELADNLWTGTRPSTWEAALRGIVGRVRGFLVAVGLGDKGLLRTEAGSYHLGPLGDVEIDLEVAALQVARSESAARGGAPVEAADAAERARGVLTRPLLAGTDGRWVEDKRRELALLHLRALDVLADARLTLGDPVHAATAAEAAIAADPFRETAYRNLIRAHARAGNRAAGLRTYERCRRLLAEELGVDPSAELQGLHLELLRDDAPVAMPAAGVASRPVAEDLPTLPYLGLRTFGEEQAAWFFGRDADTARLLERLERTRFLAVLGASGSGKSSLVRAGLVAALRAGALPGSDAWSVRVMRPGVVPLDALTAALRSLDAGHERRSLGGRAVLVVDQLEEVFTLCSEEERQHAFLDGIVSAATTAGSSTVVVVTLRADFYPRLASHPQLADLASAHQFLVTPLDEIGLAEAIEGPARLAGLAIEPGLTETILRDVARRPGALPLLQHALFELWQHRIDRTLTLASYREIGGVAGAIAQRAETTYAALSFEDQQVTRRLLLRLTDPGDSAYYTRRRVAMSEVASGVEDQAAVERIVVDLTARRLLTSDAEDGQRYVEVSHEALIRGWPRLRDWVDEDRAGLLIHRRLTAAASEWDRLGRDDDVVYRGGRLAEAAAWAERDPDASNQLERAFLAASRERAGADAEAERERRRRAETLVALARRQSARLAAQARTSTARELAAVAVANLDVDPERSILLALEAVGATRRDGHVVREAEEALHRAVKRSRVVRSFPQGGRDLALAADGTRLLTCGEDGTATLWSLDGKVLRAFEKQDGAVLATAISADCRYVVTGTADGSLRLWELDSATPSRVVGTHEGPVTGVAFAPDSRHLVSAGVDQTVRIWPLRADAPPPKVLTGHESDILDITVSPDGRRVATGSDDFTARIWELATGRSLVLRGHVWQVPGVAFSPDGRWLATAGNDGAAILWDATLGTPLRTFPNRQIAISAVAFTPDGRRLVTGSSDGTTQVRDATTGRADLMLAGHVAPVDALAVTPDGRYVLSTSVDGTTRCWDISVAGGRDWLTTPSAYLRYASLAFSPDGTHFAAPRDEDGLTIRDTRTGAVVRTLTGHPARIVLPRFSPDGTVVAGAAGNGNDFASLEGGKTLPLWDLRTGDLRVLRGHTDLVSGVAFGPDGRRLVTSSLDGTVRVWDVASGETVRSVTLDGAAMAVDFGADGWRVAVAHEDGRLALWRGAVDGPSCWLTGHTRPVTTVAFSGDVLVTGCRDEGVARVFDLAAGRERARLRGHDAPLVQVAISPDGRQAATTGEDGTVKLWDATSGLERLTFYSHDSGAHGVAFSPDGRLLASSSLDGTVAFHLLPLEEFVTLARARVTRSLTDDERGRYLEQSSLPDS
jgi:WD40 repeat protein/DNA-binding SARP family transcriptional activator/energy-coupling factor transporter ATP-binding protein EcfA2